MKAYKLTRVLMILCFAPMISFAQGAADNLHSMQDVLSGLYEEMMPMCSGMIDVGRGIAGFAALFFIGARVWKHILNAEPVDFYPLLRPFCIGFCISIFPLVMGVFSGILQPVVTATENMVKNSNQTVKLLLQQKDKVLKESPLYQMYVGQDQEGNRDQWYRYTHNNADPAGETIWDGIGNDLRFTISKATYRFKNSVKEYMSEVLHILFEAAALCINTLRTFQMIVLAILGPLVFGLSVFDGLQHTLSAWIAKYINVFLWLPVANLFGSIIGKVQEKLIALDIGQIQRTGDTFFSATDTGYLVFLLIGIVGYFTVPSVAGFVVNAGGGGALVQKMTSLAGQSSSKMMQTSSAMGSRAASGMSNIADMRQHFNQGLSGGQSGSGVSGAIGRIGGYSGGYMANKLGGQQPKPGAKKG